MRQRDQLVNCRLKLLCYCFSLFVIIKSFIVNRPRNGYETVGDNRAVSIDSFKQPEVANKVDYVTSKLHVYCKHGFELHTRKLRLHLQVIQTIFLFYYIEEISIKSDPKIMKIIKYKNLFNRGSSRIIIISAELKKNCRFQPRTPTS